MPTGTYLGNYGALIRLIAPFCQITLTPSRFGSKSLVQQKWIYHVLCSTKHSCNLIDPPSFSGEPHQQLPTHHITCYYIDHFTSFPPLLLLTVAPNSIVFAFRVHPNHIMDATAPSHPYYPRTASIPTYVANESSVLRLLMTFGLMVGVVIGLAYWQTIQSPLRLRPIDRFAVMWFALCWYFPSRDAVSVCVPACCGNKANTWLS